MNAIPTIEREVDLDTLRRPLPHDAFKPGIFRVEYPVGMSIYKLTHDHAVGATRRVVPNRSGVVSPWWFSYETMIIASRSGPVAVTGVSDVVGRTSAARSPFKDYVRARGAICFDWNVLTHLLVVELTRPVVGLLGPCSGQPLYDDPAERASRAPNVTFIGGAQQLYLPGLRPGDLSVQVFGPID